MVGFTRILEPTYFTFFSFVYPRIIFFQSTVLRRGGGVGQPPNPPPPDPPLGCSYQAGVFFRSTRQAIRYSSDLHGFGAKHAALCWCSQLTGDTFHSLQLWKCCFLKGVEDRMARTRTSRSRSTINSAHICTVSTLGLELRLHWRETNALSPLHHLCPLSPVYPIDKDRYGGERDSREVNVK